MVELLHRGLAAIQGDMPFRTQPELAGQVKFWCRPELTAEVEYLMFPPDRGFRAHSFQRLQEDWPPEECRFPSEVTIRTGPS